MHETKKSRPPELVSITDVADQLSVSTLTIRRWIASEVLPAVRLGPRLIRIRQADVDKLIGGAA